MECLVQDPVCDSYVSYTDYDRESIFIHNIPSSISSFCKMADMVQPSIGDFQYENSDDIFPSQAKEVQSWPMQQYLAHHVNDNDGYMQTNPSGNIHVGSQIGSRTFNCVPKAAENLVNGSYAYCNESPSTVENKTSGSRCYDYVAFNAEAQVDGLPLSCSVLSPGSKSQTKVIESTKTTDVLQGTENLIYLNTESSSQTGSNISFCNPSPFDIAHQPSESQVLADLLDIDSLSVIPIEAQIDIIPTVAEEQNQLPVDVSYQPPPSLSLTRPPHLGKKIKLQEKSSEKEQGSDVLPSKNEKVKPKLHEIEVPFKDTLSEKRRRDAIRAKRTRERKKNDIKLLENELNRLKKIRDSLQDEVSQLKGKENNLEKKLKICHMRFGNIDKKENV